MTEAKIQSHFSLTTFKQRPLLMLLLVVTICAVAITAVNDETTSDDLISKKQLLEKPIIRSNLENNFIITNTVTNKEKSANKADETVVSEEMAIAPRDYRAISRNIFPIQTWQSAPKKVAKPLPVVLPPPVAPPVPFVFMGKVEEGNETEYFFMQQNKLINLKVGDMVNGQWRLESEDEQYLHWTYLPMNLPQRLFKQRN